jgi:hypothetical protein
MKKMSSLFKVLILIGVVGGLMLGSFAICADKPAKNVSEKAHPNLAAAQDLIQRAFTRIVAAQKANEFDLEGHAQKAKELLEQASAEIKLAAKAANRRK